MLACRFVSAAPVRGGAPRASAPATVRMMPAVAAPRVPVRTNFNLHEFQSKQLMNAHGVNTQRWRLATSQEEATAAAKDLAAKEFVVKAQVHAGGRGKGTFDNGFKGGVHLTTDATTAGELAGKMLGHRLITKQTTADGVQVNKVMICESLDLRRELYLAILMDRSHNGPVIVASAKGGMDIEAVAEEDPSAIISVPVSINEGITDAQTRRVAEALGFEGDGVAKCQAQVKALYSLFMKTDATQVEVNPLAECDPDGDVYAVDAKMAFDENAAFRQKEIFALRDTTEEDWREVKASEFNLNYIGMDGNIGCLVNGAGLAMATMDIIQLYGGSPANFLDVGGGATERTVEESFKLITSDPSVKAILVNIFGGIVDCAEIARGVIAATKSVGLKVPLVVRLAGTNADEANRLINESGLAIQSAVDLDDAAIKAVKSLQQ